MPTPGATSATIADKELNSYVDNGDGTYSLRTSAASGGPAQSVTVSNTPLPVSSTTAAPVIVEEFAYASGNRWNSTNNSGSASAPAANTNISGNAVASVGNGYYQIDIYYGLGNTSETTACNFQLAVGGAAVANKLPSPTGVAGFWQARMYRSLNNNDAVSVINPAAAAASTQYIAGVILSRLA